MDEKGSDFNKDNVLEFISPGDKPVETSRPDVASMEQEDLTDEILRSLPVLDRGGLQKTLGLIKTEKIIPLSGKISQSRKISGPRINEMTVSDLLLEITRHLVNESLSVPKLQEMLTIIRAALDSTK